MLDSFVDGLRVDPAVIAANTASVATLQSNYAANTANIATNTANIAANTASVATLQSNYAENTANIADLQTRTTALEALPDVVTDLQDQIAQLVSANQFAAQSAQNGVAIGVGVGVGLPIVVAIAVGVGVAVRRTRLSKYDTQVDDRATRREEPNAI